MSAGLGHLLIVSISSRFAFLLADTLRVLLEARRCGKPVWDHRKARTERDTGKTQTKLSKGKTKTCIRRVF